MTKGADARLKVQKQKGGGQNESDLNKEFLFNPEVLHMKKWIAVFLGIVIGVYVTMAGIAVLINEWVLGTLSLVIVVGAIIYAIRTR